MAILLVDKPSGITSYDIIRRLKPLYPKKTKIWHAGTLDPLATWLMIIGVWPDTKRLTHLTGLDKSYIATIDFSRTSDTWDSDARETIRDISISIKQRPSILSQVSVLCNWLIPQATLPLPPFSAKKQQGKKLYELAREGIMVETTRIMHISSCRLCHEHYPQICIDVAVWSGTYIRSIAHRLWCQLGTGGIITQLRRTHIGKYSLDMIDPQHLISNTDIAYCILEEDGDTLIS